MIKEIKLPEIADNVTTAIVLEILVSAGDKVEADDTLAEMESDKATFELPSDASGVVKEVKVSEGDEVKVGQVMFTIDTEAGEEPKEEESGKEKAEESEKEKAKEPEKKKDEESEKAQKSGEEKSEADSEATAGDKEPEEEKPARKSEPAAAPADEKPARDEKPDADQYSGARPAGESPTGKPAVEVPAAPSVRRLAREIGVNIYNVAGSGPYDRITVEDVKAHAKKMLEGGRPATAAGDYELPDFSKYGGVRREKMDSIRKITAKTMAESWQSIPHVFQFDKADVTELENFRKKYSKQVEKEGAKLTLTAILLKITAEALKAFPRFNASLDMKNEEIVYKDYVNIGVAVDTERGLLVPVIRDADKKSITELSVELNEMAEKARKKKIMPDDLQGGNFAISNLGGIGGTNFTPIVYRPNVAILGVSRSQMEPVYIDGEFKPRLMLPLSLSYDHRIIDGADGARFLRWLCEAMENPLLTMFR
ncbi:MAG: biotin/lipoyl-binding protein [Marinilabiliales bacterium]|nr:MAG: biotin/lipoyl-binding protein [Marinilabiliales bacterium]